MPGPILLGFFLRVCGAIQVSLFAFASPGLVAYTTGYLLLSGSPATRLTLISREIEIRLAIAKPAR